MQAAIEEYLTHLRAERDASAHTLRNYRVDLVQFLDYLRKRRGGEADPEPAQLDQYAIRGFLAHLHGDNLAPSSVARKLAALRSFFRFLCRRGTLKSNPAELVVGPRLPRRTTAHLNLDDAFQLMLSPRYPEDSDPSGRSRDAETLSLRDRAMLELFYASGLRIGELTGLNLADLDSAQGLVRVLGKGRKERIVPVGRTAVTALRGYLDVRESLKQQIGRAHV